MTLAQEIADTDRPRIFARDPERQHLEFDLWQAAWSRLRAPRSLDPKEAQKTALRIVYDDKLSDLASELHNSGQITSPTVQRIVKLPQRVTWIEWPDIMRHPGRQVETECRVGMLLEQTATGIALLCFMKMEGKLVLIAGGSVYNLPNENGQASKLDLKYADLGINLETHQEIQAYLATATYGLVISSIPKAIEVELVTPPEKVNRARLKKHKEPIVEFKRIRIKLLEKRKQRRATMSGGSGEPTGKRAWHIVEGHFRPVKFGPGHQDVRIQWVEEYERGDPALGIILKEKRITA